MQIMASNTDGGPAFPLPFVEGKDRDGYTTYTTADDIDHGGMSLRDWFAGQALGALLDPTIVRASQSDENDIAEMAYELADAMLLARAASSPADVQRRHINEAFGKP